MLRTLPALLAFVVAAPHQEPEGEPPAPAETELHPAREMERSVHFVTASGDVDEGAIRAAIAKLDDGSELAFGPARSKERPSNSVFALALGPDAAGKDAKRLVKKGARKPASLELTVLEFVRPDGTPYDLSEEFSGNAVRGQFLGMTSEMRWVFAAGSLLTCVFEPGRMKGEELLERTRTEADAYLDGPFEVRILTEEIPWTLRGSLEPKAVKRLEKELGKLDGVAEAAVDGPSGRVRLVVTYDRLSVTGPWLGMSGVEGELPRPRFFVNPALALARRAGLELP